MVGKRQTDLTGHEGILSCHVRAVDAFGRQETATQDGRGAGQRGRRMLQTLHRRDAALSESKEAGVRLEDLHHSKRSKECSPVGAALGELAHEAACGVVVHVALALSVVSLGLDVAGNGGEVGHGCDLLCEALAVLALHAQVGGRVPIGHRGEVLIPVQLSGIEAGEHGCVSAQKHTDESAHKV